MSDKNIFLKFSQASQPKEASGGRVVGERGRNDLPPGKKGGETMTPDRHYEHKQHTFDCFCKKVLKCEAYNGYREISRRQSHEVAFSELPEDSMEQLASYDRYPWEYTSFPVEGDVILIEECDTKSRNVLRVNATLSIWSNPTVTCTGQKPALGSSQDNMGNLPA